MTAWTLCIDFGTAYSKAAAAPVDAWTSFEPGAVRPLAIGAAEAGGNQFLLDSALFVDDTRIFFGRAALAHEAAKAGEKRAALRSFKTLLSARDLDRTLNTVARGSLDPRRQFKLRDLVTLYLAYLLAAVDAARGADPLLAMAQRIDWRVATPAWPDLEARELYLALNGLFAEAEGMRKAAGAEFLTTEGLPVSEARRLLDARQVADIAPKGLIFEASAAAAYSSIGREGGDFTVVDVGAGTTDIAALKFGPSGLVDIPQGRITLPKAGDFLDRVIANVAIQSASGAKSVAEQTELWTAAMAQIRDLKETLFADGKASFRHKGRILKVTMRDVERSADFKAFMAELGDAYAHSLAVLARNRGSSEGVIQALAVGGGAAAPFIQRLIRTKPRRGNVAAVSSIPDWAHTPAFCGNLAPVFPQLAVAIGGALAPSAMLAQANEGSLQGSRCAGSG